MSTALHLRRRPPARLAGADLPCAPAFHSLQRHQEDEREVRRVHAGPRLPGDQMVAEEPVQVMGGRGVRACGGKTRHLQVDDICHSFVAPYRGICEAENRYCEHVCSELGIRWLVEKKSRGVRAGARMGWLRRRRVCCCLLQCCRRALHAVIAEHHNRGRHVIAAAAAGHQFRVSPRHGMAAGGRPARWLTRCPWLLAGPWPGRR